MLRAMARCSRALTDRSGERQCWPCVRGGTGTLIRGYAPEIARPESKRRPGIAPGRRLRIRLFDQAFSADAFLAAGFLAAGFLAGASSSVASAFAAFLAGAFFAGFSSA